MSATMRYGRAAAERIQTLAETGEMRKQRHRVIELPAPERRSPHGLWRYARISLRRQARTPPPHPLPATVRFRPSDRS